jgi:hypothetical protein
MQDTVTVSEVLALASRLSPAEKARVIAELAGDLASSQQSNARKSFIGILAHLEPPPSDEDIAEVRKEMAEGWT